MKEYSFDVDDLLAELRFKKVNARPLNLLARNLDMPKRRVLKLIDKARKEIFPDGLLIVDNGNGAYYKKSFADEDIRVP